MVDGYIMSSPAPSGPLPFSNGAPAWAARSPSPEQSMKVFASTAARPERVSISSAPISLEVFITTPTACAWNSSCAPLASTSSSAATLKAALS